MLILFIIYETCKKPHVNSVTIFASVENGDLRCIFRPLRIGLQEVLRAVVQILLQNSHFHNDLQKLYHF